MQLRTFVNFFVFFSLHLASTAVENFVVNDWNRIEFLREKDILKIKQKFNILKEKLNSPLLNVNEFRKDEERTLSTQIMYQIVSTLKNCTLGVVETKLIDQCSKELEYLDDPRNFRLAQRSKTIILL